MSKKPNQQELNQNQDSTQPATTIDTNSPSPKPGKGQSDLDPFWLESVFPDAQSVFGFRIPSAKNLHEQRCLFVLDTNALLAPYGMHQTSVSEIENLYGKLNRDKRLFVPEQAVREYAKNRTEQLKKIHNSLHQQLSNLPSFNSDRCPMLETVKEYQELLQASKSAQAAVKQYKAALQNVQSKLMEWEWDDNVTKLYNTVFNNETIISPNKDPNCILPGAKEYKAALLQDLRRRLAAKIPPGYKDGAKADEGIGDVLIWHSILELGRSKTNSVVFVSGEEKADWVCQSQNTTISPRTELCYEFYQATTKHFALIAWPNFLKIVGAPNDVVEEAIYVANPPPANLLLTRYLRDLSRLVQNLQHNFESNMSLADETTFNRIRRRCLIFLEKHSHASLNRDLDYIINQVKTQVADIVSECDKILTAWPPDGVQAGYFEEARRRIHFSYRRLDRLHRHALTFLLN